MKKINIKRKMLLVYASCGLILPLFFQNCSAGGGQSFSSTVVSASAKSVADSVPDAVVAESGPSSSQVIDNSSPSDISDAEQLCEAQRQGHEHGRCDSSSTSEQISGLRGKNILTPEDFGGSRHVDCINDVRGRLILCDLDVDNLQNINGQVILVKSKVAKCDSKQCHVDLHSDKSQSVSFASNP